MRKHFIVLAAIVAQTLVSAAPRLVSALGADSTDWIASLGGKVEKNSQGHIVAVNLRGTWVNDVELIDLARLPNLERLDLSHTRITDEGMRHLKTATSIRELKLYFAEQITDQGMTAIKDWKMLKRLDVRGTRISNGTLEILSHMSQLEALDIANTQVTDNGMDFLIALTGLKELALGRSRAGEADLSFLRMLPSLTYLDLSGARPLPPDMGGAKRRVPPPPVMSQKTLDALAELRNLRTLKLGYSGISSGDLKDLSTLQNVEKLGLEECSRVDDAAVALLAHWKSLKYVDLQATKITPEGVEMLRKARPGIQVLHTPASADVAAVYRK
jgi:Leucine-rich repeat (LRR) protein